MSNLPYNGGANISNYRVLIADDHPLYRTALVSLVRDAFDQVEILEVENIASALQQLGDQEIDLVLLDLTMPDAKGLEGLRALRATSPSTPVIICSAHDDPTLVRDAFKVGISGFLPKSSAADVTRHALQLVRSGGVYIPSEVLIEQAGKPEEQTEPHPEQDGPFNQLTPRQKAVLALLEQGLSNKLIARELDIGEITVKAHVSAILRKLGVENRVQAVVAARTMKE